MSPTVQGTPDITAGPDSGAVTEDALGLSVKYVLRCAAGDFASSYLALADYRDSYSLGDPLDDGDTYGPIISGALFEKAEYNSLPGGVGELILYGGKRNPIYEMEWQDLEKPLESSFYYQAGLVRTDDYFPTYMNGLQLVKAQAQSGQPYTAPYDDDYTDYYADFYNAIVSGESSYVTQAPIFRATTYSATATDYSSDGFVSGITGNFNDSTFTSDSINGYYDGAEVPSGWIWRVKSDRNMRQGPNGIYVRITEYEGAEYWDTNIYGDPS